MLFYRSSLRLSRQTLQYVTGFVGRHRRQVGSKGWALPAGMQALMTLAYLKNGERFAQLGAGFRGRNHHRLALRRRDGNAAVGPITQTHPGAGQGQE